MCLSKLPCTCVYVYVCTCTCIYHISVCVRYNIYTERTCEVPDGGREEKSAGAEGESFPRGFVRLK